MIDIHQHLLWGMDDGAETPEQMQTMLLQASAQGITAVAATPHAAPGIHPFDAERYQERLTEARNFCREENLPLQIHSGAEVAWTYQTVLALRQGSVPTLADTDYVLLELWHNISWQEARDAVRELTRAGFCPVLAHPERYLAFLLSPGGTIRFREQTGALLQVNAATFLNPRGILEKRFVKKLLENYAVDAVASDAHGKPSRPVNLALARDWLREHTDETYAQSLITFGGILS